jgi:hypothetical protein
VSHRGDQSILANVDTASRRKSALRDRRNWRAVRLGQDEGQQQSNTWLICDKSVNYIIMKMLMLGLQ